MKKLAIMGSGSGLNFEAIAGFFCKNDIEITCLSDIENSDILKKAEFLQIKYKYLPSENNLKYFTENKFDLVAMADYKSILSEDVLKLSKFVNIHPSILPAFNSENAIQDAFLAGVKLSGVTIHWVEKNDGSGKIIAQYPVFINNSTRFDEFQESIHNIENKLYPVVIEALLNDVVFDFQDFMNNSKSQKHNCSGGCGNCNH